MTNYKAAKCLLLTAVLWLTGYTTSFSQNCGCTVTFKVQNTKRGLNILDGRKAPFNKVKPGGTLCIQGGNYQQLRLRNFIGTSGRPITIKNCGGQVTTQGGLNVSASRYIKISGAGKAGIKYGIKIKRAKGAGLDLTGLTSNVEVENMEIQNTGFAGIMAKTDPQCNKPKTWRQNFTFHDLKIHDCYIHDTHGEGMYIGFTGGFEQSNRKCNGRPIFGHLIKTVRIYDNLIVRAGWDGFQLNLAVQDVKVYRNTVIGYGTQKRLYQNFGWSIGAGTRGRFYNNFIYQLNSFKSPQMKGSGVQIISNQDTFFYNNVIVNSERHGIFVHNRLSRHKLNFKEGYYFLNNTIVGSGLSGMLYNSASSNNPKDQKFEWRRIFYNNLIVAPRSKHHKTRTWKGMKENYVDFNTKTMRDRAKVNIQKNVFAANMQEARFANPRNLVIDANNYQLAKGAKGINGGRNVSQSFGVRSDFNGTSRNTGGASDIGAFEYNTSDNFSKVKVSATRTNNRVNFKFGFKLSGKSSISIENIRGNKVHQLYTGFIKPGARSFTWNNSRRGLYRINIKIGNYQASKFIMVR